MQVDINVLRSDAGEVQGRSRLTGANEGDPVRCDVVHGFIDIS